MAPSPSSDEGPWAFLRPSHLNRFLYATVWTEGNGMDMSVLSLLARSGKDPWAEAARLADLPTTSAADSLACTIAGLPRVGQAPAHAKTVALCLAALLPEQSDALPGAAVPTRRARHRAAALLTGTMLGLASALWVLIGTAVWAVSHPGGPGALVDAAAANEPSLAVRTEAVPVAQDVPGHSAAAEAGE